jgi:membrane-bound metal-dependent hydrolase YbcI (DUF457 family)
MLRSSGNFPSAQKYTILLFKHGGTHSIVGAVLLASTGALLMAEDQRRSFWLFLLGTLSHLPLDTVSSRSGIPPFLPWSPWRAAGLEYLDVPLRVLALASAAALWLHLRRTRRSSMPH